MRRSPRWLWTHNREREALKVLCDIERLSSPAAAAASKRKRTGTGKSAAAHMAHVAADQQHEVLLQADAESIKENNTVSEAVAVSALEEGAAGDDQTQQQHKAAQQQHAAELDADAEELLERVLANPTRNRGMSHTCTSLCLFAFISAILSLKYSLLPLHICAHACIHAYSLSLLFFVFSYT